MPGGPPSPAAGSSANGSGAPTISVVVATRDRRAELRACVASILASRHESFEVVVVDQSEAADPPAEDVRVRYVASESRGKSAALNEGIGLAGAEVLAFTDDDCIVTRDWLARAEELFAQHGEISLAFGNLVAAEHDPTQSFVPIADMRDFEVVHGTRAALLRGGAGANMAARRELFDRIGGFDERIGPGSEFRACEEYDLYYRALAAGESVARDPSLVVIHHGARPYAGGVGDRLIRSYCFGEGAVFGKHLRSRDRGMLRPAGTVLVLDALSVFRPNAHPLRRRLEIVGSKVLGLLAAFVAY